jgi:hypothetical protein
MTKPSNSTGAALQLEPKHRGAHEYIGETYLPHRQQGQGARAPGRPRAHLRHEVRGISRPAKGHRLGEMTKHRRN